MLKEQNRRLSKDERLIIAAQACGIPPERAHEFLHFVDGIPEVKPQGQKPKQTLS